MRKIRILFLPPVDAQNTNAQSLNTREIVLRLDPSRFEISLVYWREPDPRLLNHEHIRLLRLPSRLKTLRLLREMWSGYDIIAYVDYSPASYLFLHLPRIVRGRVRTVLHTEGAADLGDASMLLRFLYGGVIHRCDVFTAITEWVARGYAAILHRQARHILPVGVDASMFAPPRTESSHGATVLFVGTLMRRKEPLQILAAAARFPQVKFRMIGSGRYGYEKVVAGKAAEMGLANLSIEGGKSQAMIAEAMRVSDVFVLPSRSEGLPKVTLEAAASGLPCIVFRDYETPSVIDRITGFQVSTPEEMMEKLGLLLDDPALCRRMGQAARQHAEKFDWGVISRQWEQAYLDIAGQDQASR